MKRRYQAMAAVVVAIGALFIGIAAARYFTAAGYAGHTSKYNGQTLREVQAIFGEPHDDRLYFARGIEDQVNPLNGHLVVYFRKNPQVSTVRQLTFETSRGGIRMWCHRQDDNWIVFDVFEWHGHVEL